MAAGSTLKARFLVTGIVQGVGFRPYVARLARAHGLTGSVRNALGPVEILAHGPLDALDAFARQLPLQAPAGSRVDGVERWVLPPNPRERCPNAFVILGSGQGQGGPILPPADLALCADCLADLSRPGDPRHGNPFISCTHCGPRFTVIRQLPYDRANTALDAFPLCPFCGGEYRDPNSRRYHAQTLCCNACGPTLCYHHREGAVPGNAPALKAAIRALKSGGILALKGVGGYHLACSPFDEEALLALRQLKGRDHKPFALMFPDLPCLETYCQVSSQEKALLLSPARPIVLLRRKESAIHPTVYGKSRELGAFLPYTGLHHLILRETGPLVMTSANVSGQPILREDAPALAWIMEQPALNGVLAHDRPILRRADDSVAAITLDKPLMIRRARGYVPQTLAFPPDCPPLLALGAQQKSTLCLCQSGHAYLSVEMGDLDNASMTALYHETLAQMQALLHIQPKLLIHDLHPDYPTTRLAPTLGLPTLAVQHHHAHIASVMAEHGLREPILGVAMDGTGYGPDGTIWGGEFLLVSPEGYQRLGHLKPMPLLGGDESIRQGWKTAACMLWASGLSLAENPCLSQTHDDDFPTGSLPGIPKNPRPALARDADPPQKLAPRIPSADPPQQSAPGIPPNPPPHQACDADLPPTPPQSLHANPRLPLVYAALEHNINTLQSSSMGRIFDAASAILGICQNSAYEGQGAIELEQCAAQTPNALGNSLPSFPFTLTESNGKILADLGPCLIELHAHRHQDPSPLAWRFHRTVANLIITLCKTLAARQGIKKIALSGGVFQNRLLLSLTLPGLMAAGLTVYRNEQIPPGDGGLALGQAYIAAIRPPKEASPCASPCPVN